MPGTTSTSSVAGFALVTGILLSPHAARAQGSVAESTIGPPGKMARMMTDDERRRQDAGGRQLLNTPHPTYRGGALIEKPLVFSLYWGSNVRFIPQLIQFYSDVSNSRFIDILDEWSTSDYRIGRGVASTGYVWDEAPYTNWGATINSGIIQWGMGAMIDAGIIPLTRDLIIMNHFAPGVTIADGDFASCRVYCAFHTSFNYKGMQVRYSVMPDHSGGCSGGCGGGWNVPDEMGRTMVTSSHELVETITDPDPNSGWYDDQFQEISDICNQQPAIIGKWYVQKQWSNAYNTCIAP